MRAAIVSYDMRVYAVLMLGMLRNERWRDRSGQKQDEGGEVDMTAGRRPFQVAIENASKIESTHCRLGIDENAKGPDPDLSAAVANASVVVASTCFSRMEAYAASQSVFSLSDEDKCAIRFASAFDGFEIMEQVWGRSCPMSNFQPLDMRGRTTEYLERRCRMLL